MSLLLEGMEGFDVHRGVLHPQLQAPGTAVHAGRICGGGEEASLQDDDTHMAAQLVLRCCLAAWCHLCDSGQRVHSAQNGLCEGLAPNLPQPTALLCCPRALRLWVNLLQPGSAWALLTGA
jgi:hypothetical protein